MHQVRRRVLDIKDVNVEDGTGGTVHDVENVVRCASKLFAEGGELFEYYLNESKDFKVRKLDPPPPLSSLKQI